MQTKLRENLTRLYSEQFLDFDHANCPNCRIIHILRLSRHLCAIIVTVYADNNSSINVANLVFDVDNIKPEICKQVRTR